SRCSGGRGSSRSAGMSETWTALAYLLVAICFIAALKGLSSPRTARWGNLIGAVGAAIAVVVILLVERPDRLLAILAAMLVGAAGGAVAARRVAMTAMPQLVAIFNGVGGAAGAAVAALEITAGEDDRARLAVAAFTVLIGAVTLT